MPTSTWTSTGMYVKGKGRRGEGRGGEGRKRGKEGISGALFKQESFTQNHSSVIFVQPQPKKHIFWSFPKGV